MTPWVYVLLVVGLVLVVLVILQLFGVPWPSAAPSDYTTDPITDLPPTVPAATAAPSEPHYVYKGLVREQAVCTALETIYRRGFPTVRPSWLLNPATGHTLEYDCYNDELRIAAEHNGIHHYEYPNKFHKSEQEFLAQRARDEHKRRLSDEHGVYLLTVPYWVPMESIKDWVEYYCPERVAQRTHIEGLTPPKH